MVINDLWNVCLFVIQVLALVWGLAFSLRFLFGFGLDENGEIEVSNKRGMFLAKQAGRTKDSLFNFARFLRGKTHSTSMTVTGPDAGVIKSSKEGAPRDEQAAS